MENLEIWKPVIGFENAYEISSLGRVKRTYKHEPQRILKLKLNTRGYPFVSLSYNKVFKNALVHRLVGFSFLKMSYKPNLEINHKNGIKEDNRPENLEWVTHVDNVKHAVSIGLKAKFMLLLPNNCRVGKFSVYPSNWKTSRANHSLMWRIGYWFFDDSLNKKKTGHYQRHEPLRIFKRKAKCG